MRRTTRSSLAAAAVATADGDSIVVTSTVSSPQPDVKRPRGRPSKVKLEATDTSTATTPASTSFTSCSEESTPLTSNVATPSASVDGLPTASSKRTGRASRIEVVLPTVKAPARRLNQSIYSMNNKRKRDVVDDSEDDYSDNSPDAKVARKLQREEEEEVDEQPISKATMPSRGTFRVGGARRSLRGSVFSTNASSASVADSNEFGASELGDSTSARTAGKANLRKSILGKQATTQKRQIIADSEDDNDLLQLSPSRSDSDDSARIRKAALAAYYKKFPPRRVGSPEDHAATKRGKATKPPVHDDDPPLSSSDDDEDDKPASFREKFMTVRGGLRKGLAAPKISKAAMPPVDDNGPESFVQKFLARRGGLRKDLAAPAAPKRGKAAIPPIDDDAPPLSSSDDELTVRGGLRKGLAAPKRGKAAMPPVDDDSDDDSNVSSFDLSALQSSESDEEMDDVEVPAANTASTNAAALRAAGANRRAYRARTARGGKRIKKDRKRLEDNHPELKTMWDDLEKMPALKAGKAEQPKSISRQLKPFQLEGLAWMKAMEKTEWKGGLLGDEMGLGKTIQAVSLIMSDWPAKKPSLVLVPPVALMQWMTEIDSYTDGTLKTLVFHGTNAKSKNLTIKDIKKYDVIIMSYNSLESMYRKQEKGFKRKDGLFKEKSVVHQTEFHRVILDEAHSIKTRTTMTAKACFALKVTYRWCLTGTPLQNRIGEFFSLVRFLNIKPFASYLCKQCSCCTLEWSMNEDGKCTHCNHYSMSHVSVFNQELLNPILKFGNRGKGAEAFQKLRILTDRIMLRRLKKDHTNAMELPVKEINVERQFFGEEENDFANSIMTSGRRKFDTYVATGVLLNNYANIFGLIMQMRQVADHPDLILKKNSEGGQNILVCNICDEPAEDAIRSRCKHDFCRICVKSYLHSATEPECPHCHIPLSIDLEQPEIEQDEATVKKSSIINRIKMENWTSSSKIELLVHELHKLRSDNASHKSIIFSQFTTMLQLIEWRLRRAGITTVMLDGSMTPAQRQASIEHFMKNADVECFLVSLKAGGVALNLTEASRVFIVDPWWNPAAEWQSADRCHRIGQTRPCTITRLCIEDSVESRMVLLQEKKTSMINSTINADDAAMDSLSPEDLQFLFRGS
ncbi:SNF2 family N-terminal domain-containing protein [Apodospora peruviana]|uniref:SNF2 family N-terminal domain-containing protein n=1 Tax=Apodospora peruviana TaxID=516989 RepID=A0AAE0MBQ7_9PEZI|nr:SNF2 family N-terminal domain-containing protein [Apodospora peruviana]